MGRSSAFDTFSCLHGHRGRRGVEQKAKEYTDDVETGSFILEVSVRPRHAFRFVSQELGLCIFERSPDESRRTFPVG